MTESKEMKWFKCKARKEAGGGELCHKDWYGCTLRHKYKCPKESTP